jgi:hypothetical protein
MKLYQAITQQNTEDRDREFRRSIARSMKYASLKYQAELERRESIHTQWWTPILLIYTPINLN